MTRQINVLVTGVGGRSVGHQVLQALLLAGDRYRIICTDGDAYSFGLYEVDSRYVVPLAEAADYCDAIEQIVERERIDVILIGTEAEIPVLLAIRARLAERGCLLIASPPEAVALCSDKGRLYRWLAAQGFGVPGSAGVADWKALVGAVGFPLIGKPARQSGGSRNVAILATTEEVTDYIASFPGPSDDIVFQEYVGDAESEYTVGVVVSGSGQIIDSIVLHRKLIGLSLGATRVVDGIRIALSTGYSQGFIVRDPSLSSFCEELALRMGMRGPVNIQLRRDRTGGIKVFEVHPRFSGTTSIRASAGFNEPDMVIRDQLLAEDVGRQPYRSNVAAIRAFRSILVPEADLAATQRAPLSVR